MEGQRQQRAGAGEATMRDVNESIERGRWPGDEDTPVGFRCECARVGRNRLVELTVRQYEHIRSHPRRFVVVPGHELPDVEMVVATGRATSSWRSEIRPERARSRATVAIDDPRG